MYSIVMYRVKMIRNATCLNCKIPIASTNINIFQNYGCQAPMSTHEPVTNKDRALHQ